MNKIVENYNSLDSMYLSDQGNFGENVPAIVSARNSLNICGGKYILYHFENMKNLSHLTLWMVDEMIEDAKDQFDDNDIKLCKVQHTFLSFLSNHHLGSKFKALFRIIII